MIKYILFLGCIMATASSAQFRYDRPFTCPSWLFAAMEPGDCSCVPLESFSVTLLTVVYSPKKGVIKPLGTFGTTSVRGCQYRIRSSGVCKRERIFDWGLYDACRI